MVDEFDAQVTRLATLGEPVRRRLYRWVCEQREAVSREQAATALGVAHHVAKFHLDRLEHDRLLECEYRRPAGRTGPGAGRPTKLYRRAAGDLALSLPTRRYELAARVLAAAISDAEAHGTPLEQALPNAARRIGRQLGAESPGDVAAVLDAHGFAPYPTDEGLALANCPFHSLAQDYPALVCGLNRDLVRGLVEGSGTRGLRARLDPGPDRCCVTVRRR